MNKVKTKSGPSQWVYIFFSFITFNFYIEMKIAFDLNDNFDKYMITQFLSGNGQEHTTRTMANLANTNHSQQD